MNNHATSIIDEQIHDFVFTIAQFYHDNINTDNVVPWVRSFVLSLSPDDLREYQRAATQKTERLPMSPNVSSNNAVPPDQHSIN